MMSDPRRIGFVVLLFVACVVIFMQLASKAGDKDEIQMLQSKNNDNQQALQVVSRLNSLSEQISSWAARSQPPPCRCAITCAAAPPVSPKALCTLPAPGTMSPQEFGALVRKTMLECYGTLDFARASFDRRISAIHDLQQAASAMMKRSAEMVEGFTAEYTILLYHMATLTIARAPSTVCEIGFNGGHSAITWLIAGDAAKYYGFDLGAHSYSRPIFEFLQVVFPDRMQIMWGDSTKTLPEFVSQHPGFVCDVAFVDGGHFGDIPAIDIKNMLRISNERTVMAMDDVLADSKCEWMVAPTQAWDDVLARSVIAETERVVIPNQQCRGLVAGRVLSRG